MSEKLAEWKVDVALNAVAHGLWTPKEGTDYLKKEWKHTNGRDYNVENDAS